MKLLFDQNLSRKLVSRLADVFPESSHVQFHGLIEADVESVLRAGVEIIQPFIDSTGLDCLELY